MIIADHPLHRSGRARLTHPAPALGSDAKAAQRIRMMELGPGEPTVNQPEHTLPRQPRLLAATPQRAVPVASDMVTKRTQRRQIRRHTIITMVSLDHRPQPLSYCSHALVHSFAQFRFDRLQLCAFPLTHRAPPDREHSVASLLTADMREAKKVECFRLPLAAPFATFGCVAAKLDHARFLGMQFQFELGKAFCQLFVEPLGVRLVLKTHDEVIGPANDDYLALGLGLTPVLHPEVEHVVQIDVSQQRRGTAPLRRSLFTARPLSLFHHARVQPFPDEPHHALVCYSVLEKLNQPLMVQTIEERT